MNNPLRINSHDSSVLDFLRAQAVTLVLVEHILDVSGRPAIAWLSQRLGWMGVMFFFVHTSLVLMFSLERTRAHQTALLKHFYVRRAFRIYPLAILVILIVLAFQIPVATSHWTTVELSWRTVAANVLLIQNLVYSPSVLGPLWTLPLEIQMYVLLPLIFLLVGRGQRPKVAAALWLGAVVLALVQPAISGRLNVLTYAPCFMGGVLAYCWSKRTAAAWPFGLWVLALSTTMLLFLGLDELQGEGNPMAFSWGLTLTVGWLIPHFAETRSRFVKQASATVAKYSYGIYLTHMFALWVACTKLSGAGLSERLLVGGVLLVVLPLLTYHAIEVPGIRLGTRLARRFLEPVVSQTRAIGNDPAARPEVSHTIRYPRPHATRSTPVR